MPLSSPTFTHNPNSHKNPNLLPPLKTPIFQPTKSPIPHFFLTLTTKSPNPSSSTFTSFTSLRPFQLHDTPQGNSSHDINYDSFLSIVEFLCFVSSAAISIQFVVNSALLSSQKPAIAAWLGNGGFVWQSVLLASAVAISALIRRRQWRRICTDLSESEGEGGNLIERIEKMEEDVRSSVNVVRGLSRKLERLGIRFRVTRRSLKEPIAETAALAQKNSDATRALAVQEDMLEKELSEIQQVLLAMQEQQQKQLELILAIGKAGKLWDTKREPTQDQEAIG